MENSDDTYTELIRELQEKCGMTFADIAAEGGFSQQSIYNWVRGTYEPDKTSRERIRRMAKDHNVYENDSSLSLLGLNHEQKAIIKDLRDSLREQNKSFEAKMKALKKKGKRK
jgi:transcriptional regulator with XRE-family HTH domain